MNQYLITFTTLDENINQVYVDAISESAAIKIFESSYQFNYILKIDVVS